MYNGLRPKKTALFPLREIQNLQRVSCSLPFYSVPFLRKVKTSRLLNTPLSKAAEEKLFPIRSYKEPQRPCTTNSSVLPPPLWDTIPPNCSRIKISMWVFAEMWNATWPLRRVHSPLTKERMPQKQQ